MNLKQIKKKLKIGASICLIISMFPLTTFAAPTSAETQQEISKLETEVQNNLKEINNLEQELISVGEKIIKNKESLKKAEADYENQYEDTKDIIQFLYENNTDNIKTEKVVSSKSIASLNSDLEYINQIEDYTKDKLTKFKKTADKVKKLQTELENEQQDLEKKDKEFKEKNKELEKQISDKKIDLAELIQKENLQGSTFSSITKRTTTFNPDDYSSIQEKIVKAAESQLGTPYVWGGTTPNVGLDCSGLTQFCYAQANISIPRTSEAQTAAGQIVETPRVGDLASYSYHIGVVISVTQNADGSSEVLIIHAPQEGDVVKISKVWGNPVYVRYF